MALEKTTTNRPHAHLDANGIERFLNLTTIRGEANHLFPDHEKYLELLPDSKLTQACWIDLTFSQCFLISGKCTVTNRELLDYICQKNQAKPLQELKYQTYAKVSEYLHFWLGPDYKYYATQQSKS